MLEIFNEYHLNKYITSPCAPHVDPLHPTLDESIDMIRNLRTVNLIKSRQTSNQVSRQASSDKFNSSKIANHVN